MGSRRVYILNAGFLHQFVAITHSRKEFVSSSTATNLQQRRPEFFKCFEVITAEAYVSSLHST